MNRVTLAQSVLSMMGDADQTLWSRADLYAYIQDGLLDFQRKTLCTWKRVPLNDVADQATYTLPEDFYQLDRAEYDGWRCVPVNPRNQMAGNGAFETTGGRPFSFMMSGDGFNVLRKVGVPTEDSTDKFWIEFFAVGPTLDDVTDIPLPARYLRYLAFYVMSQAYGSDGDGQDLKLAQLWADWYGRGVEMAKARMNAFARRRVARLGRDRVDPSRMGRSPGTLPAWYPVVR